MSLTVCQPGDDLHALANQGQPGDAFLLTAGVYRGQCVLPQDGQTFIGEPGAILDGGGETAYGFCYDDGIRHPRAVTLRGFTVQAYTGGAGRGAIFGANTTSWVLDHLVITGTTQGRGIDAGPGMIVRDCRVEDNYLAGLNGYQAHDLLIDGCEFAFNNMSLSDPDTAGGEGAGVKLGTCAGARIRGTVFHDNYGPGLWFDSDCHDAQVFHCHTADNSHRGIHIEISDTIAILDTICCRDGVGRPELGGAGIFVSSSSNVTVAHYQFVGCRGLSEYNHPDRGIGPYGRREIRNFIKHDCRERAA